jgi:pimeloyl-ACP methyl ester carboxylesterase
MSEGYNSSINAPSQFLTVNDTRYAYRRFGPGGRLPLLFLQHFTGTLDNWDPALADGHRRVPGRGLSGFG